MRRYHAALLAHAEGLLASEIPDGWLERHSGGWPNANPARRRAWLREHIAIVRMAESLGLRPARTFTLRWDDA